MVKNTNLKTAEKEYVDEVVSETQLALYAMAKKWDEEKQASLLMLVEKIRDDSRIYNDAISGIQDNIKSINNNIEGINNTLDIINVRLDGIDGRLDGIDGRLDNLEGDVGQIKTYIFDNVEPRIHVLEFRDRETA